MANCTLLLLSLLQSKLVIKLPPKIIRRPLIWNLSFHTGEKNPIESSEILHNSCFYLRFANYKMRNYQICVWGVWECWIEVQYFNKKGILHNFCFYLSFANYKMRNYQICVWECWIEVQYFIIRKEFYNSIVWLLCIFRNFIYIPCARL